VLLLLLLLPARQRTGVGDEDLPVNSKHFSITLVQ